MSTCPATVIIVNWNCGQFLDECLHHLLQQSCRPAKILVMDNGSEDGSAERAQQLPGVTVRMLGANLGFAAANNLALEECTTEYVVLLNPDAYPEPDWLHRLVSAAKARPQVAAFGSRQMIYGRPAMIDGIGDVYHVSGLVWRNGHGRSMQAEDDMAAEIFSPCACAVLYRREALREVGGFDEDYFCYVEDIDLGFRLRLAGYTAMVIPDAVVHHVGSGSTGGQHSDFSVYHGHRNLIWTYFKNVPGWLFWALLPAHLALNAVSIAYFIWRGQGKVILKAKWDALRQLPKMWRKRQRIQQARRVGVMDIWHMLDKRLMPSRKNKLAPPVPKRLPGSSRV